MTYYLVNGFWKLFSLLPLGFLYFLSDCIYYLLYYCIRYRRKVVRKNLVNSFPDRTLREIISIEKGFYAWFCDYVVETIKVRGFSEEEMKRRMTSKVWMPFMKIWKRMVRRFVLPIWGIIAIGNGCLHFRCGPKIN